MKIFHNVMSNMFFAILKVILALEGFQTKKYVFFEKL